MLARGSIGKEEACLKGKKRIGGTVIKIKRFNRDNLILNRRGEHSISSQTQTKQAGVEVLKQSPWAGG